MFHIVQWLAYITVVQYLHNVLMIMILKL